MMNRKMDRTISFGVLGVLVLTLLPACFSLGRASPALEEYVIGGAPPADAVAPLTALDGLAVGVRRLDLAAYLATPEIVVRRGAHEVVKSDFHRWAGDPADGINRAVARHLTRVAALRTVDVAPWPVRSPYDYLVQLHVTRFEGVLPGVAPAAGSGAGPVPGAAAKSPADAAVGAAHVRATWEILRPRDGAVLARGATDHTGEGWRVGDYAALVALLDEGLAVVSRDVAVAMAGLVSAASAVDPGGEGGP